MIARMPRPRHLLTVIFFTSFLIFLFFKKSISPWDHPLGPQEYGGSWTDGAPWVLPELRAGDAKASRNAKEYVEAIMTREAALIPKLSCPRVAQSRYQHLAAANASSSTRSFFFALDLRQVVHLLPTLLGSIVEVMRFLGPRSCALSIVEGNSDDGTYEVLRLFASKMDELGVAFFLQTTDINPKRGDRIGKLAKLRNLALEPLLNHVSAYDPDPTILFLNDVAICAEDILELLHQKSVQGADMTCAYDWHPLGGRYKGRLAPYDIWVARGINGDTFTDIPALGDWFRNWDDFWANSWNEFWNDGMSRARFEAHKPFQVFACWNGAVAITGRPFIHNKLAFRRSRPGECEAGEPTLLNKDMWNMGFGKIAVVPSVHLGYTVDEGKRVKGEKGHTSKWAQEENRGNVPLKIDWRKEPPQQVKCMPSFGRQWWAPWNDAMEAPP